MNFWDQRFAEPGFKYGTEPNVYLTQVAAQWSAPLRVLVPGDGEGRNGVWLAQQGHQVTSVDNSSVGLKKAQELATQRGVPLQTQWADLAEWQPEAAQFDALVLIYTHLPPSFRQRTHRALAHALKPGGWVVVEAFHPQQLQHQSGGPKDLGMLYTPELLRQDFDALVQEVQCWSGEVHLSEGPGHQGLAHVTRWLGRRAAS